MPCLVAIVLHPWIPCCPLHKYQHMPCLVAIVDCTHGYHVVHCTNISTCHVLLLLLTVPMDTMLSTAQISAHAMSCCYCSAPMDTMLSTAQISAHAMSCCYCSAPMDTMLSTAQISAHAMSCCYCSAPT